MSYEKKSKFLLNTAFVVVILLLIYICIKYLIGLLLPFIIALIIAFLLQPVIVALVNKTKVSRKIVAPIITAIFMAVVMTFIVFLIYRLISELGSFVGMLPGWYEEIAPVVSQKIESALGSIIRALPDELGNSLIDIASNFSNYLQTQLLELSKSALAWVANTMAKLPTLLLTILIIVIATFFTAGKTDKMKAMIKRQIPEKYQSVSGQMYRTFGSTVWKMLKSYVLIFIITFIELTVGLFIIGIDYFWIIALLTAIVDILPVVGTGTILIPWGILEIILGDTAVGIGILVLYIIITVIRNIIEPKLVSKQIGLPPILTLLGMYVGLKLFGILGLFLIPLLMILIKTANDIGAIHIWKDEQGDAEKSECEETEK